MTSPDIRFMALGAPRRVWAVSAVHGEAERLYSLHEALIDRIAPGDRLLYFGNYTGYGAHSRETVDELLAFRRMVLAIPGMMPQDIVYLRGGQEDIWQRLIQLQFCPNPVDMLLWMLANGLSATMQSYGLSPHDGVVAAREGVMPLTRWTASIRDALRRNPGHDIFMTQPRRAAYTDDGNGGYPALFVNAGIDAARPLDEQNDSLWWADGSFDSMTQAYAPFGKVIRGYDPRHAGVRINCVTASLDGGCGFGGSLVCAGMSGGGEIFEMLEA